MVTRIEKTLQGVAAMPRIAAADWPQKAVPARPARCQKRRPVTEVRSGNTGLRVAICRDCKPLGRLTICKETSGDPKSSMRLGDRAFVRQLVGLRKGRQGTGVLARPQLWLSCHRQGLLAYARRHDPRAIRRVRSRISGGSVPSPAPSDRHAQALDPLQEHDSMPHLFVLTRRRRRFAIAAAPIWSYVP